ncbi:DUF4139 domain-containing protein [Emcibacter sp. SYSU 3D8]|uniref:DUF4139 domain-containing protein n=1 Tax=Emcibacter sp. SYSU 3D8 TaxID=3133969 RepID=UPI0031FEDB5F
MRATALTAAILVSAACGGAAWAEDASVTLQDRKALSLTVYNGGTGLVRDTRTVAVPAGRSTVSFIDVSAQIQAETALLKNAPFDVLEQNFDFDLLSPDKLLEKSVGRTVQLHRLGPDGRETVETATLLGANGGIVLKVGDHIETMSGASDASRRLTFDSLPGNLRSRPTLSMAVNSGGAVSRDLMLTYMTGGLDWKADYVANLAPDEKSLSLQGWISITNTSGTPYEQAQVQVVAGQVNQAPPPRGYARDKGMEMMTMSASRMPQEESFFEYHLYTLPGSITLAENQTKQVALLEAPKITATRVLESRGGNWSLSRVGDMQPQPASITLKFGNDDRSGLGTPLPGGTVRVYKDDSRGQVQFVGADSIRHTPRNEKVELSLGQAFDVTVKRKQTDFRQTNAQNGQLIEATSSWEVTVKNGKKEAAEVRVVELLQGDWRITAESRPHQKEAANMAVWNVRAPAEGQTTFTYTVVTRNVP